MSEEKAHAQAEEKEPPIWPDFFDGVMKKLNLVMESRRADRVRSQLTPEKRILELRAEVRVGLLTRKFLDGEFWKEVLEPFLRNEAQLKPWAPGGPLPLEEVSTLHLWNSGKVYLLGVMVRQFGKWIEAGEGASKTLAEDAKKKELLTRR